MIATRSDSMIYLLNDQRVGRAGFDTTCSIQDATLILNVTYHVS